MPIIFKFLRALFLVLIISLIECHEGDEVASDDNLKRLSEDNWAEILQGEWMVEFFAPWCPACRNLEPIWKDFASWAATLNTKVAQIDVTENPGLSGRFVVTALPTIYHVKNGEFRQYRGPRLAKEFTGFLEEEKWKTIDPLPSWKHPASIQMSFLSYVFRISMVLRNAHTILMEKYGLPYWGSYLVFGLVTLIVGALLGLLLVCLADCMFPSKKANGAEKNEIDGKTDEDLVSEADEDFECLNSHKGDGDSSSENKLSGLKKRATKAVN